MYSSIGEGVPLLSVPGRGHKLCNPRGIGRSGSFFLIRWMTVIELGDLASKPCCVRIEKAYLFSDQSSVRRNPDTKRECVPGNEIF